MKILRVGDEWRNETRSIKSRISYFGKLIELWFELRSAMSRIDYFRELIELKRELRSIISGVPSFRNFMMRMSGFRNVGKAKHGFNNTVLAVRDETGSAIVEFVLLAIPLLIPIVIYLGAVYENSSINSDLHNFARQSARAFITSPSESYESARLQSVLQTFETRVFQPDGISEIPTVSVECSATPCLTPDARVKVTVSLEHDHNNLSGIFRFISAPVQQFSVSDVQIVDAWR